MLRGRIALTPAESTTILDALLLAALNKLPRVDLIGPAQALVVGSWITDERVETVKVLL